MLDLRKTKGQKDQGWNKISFNKILWVVAIVTMFFWLCYKLGDFYSNGLFWQNWYYLLAAIPVVCLVILHWRRDKSLKLCADKFERDYDKKSHEVSKEARRKNVFLSKHPVLNHLPVIGPVTRWAYVNGATFVIAIILIGINAWFIRINNLGVLPIQNDEFLSYGAIKYIVDGNLSFKDMQYGADSNLSDDFYSRALPYSLGAAWTVDVLGGDYMNYFNLRLFSVLCGMATLVVFYFLMRRHFSKITVLFSLFGLSVFYMFVYYSRLARMYSFHILLFFIMVLILDRLFLKIEKDPIARLLNPGQTLRYYATLIKENYPLILLFIAVLILDLKTHYTGIFILPIIFAYSVLLVRRHKQLLYPVVLVAVAVIAFLILFFSGFHFLGDWYFNSRKLVYWKFFDYNYTYLRGGYLTLPLFFLPIIFYKKIPSLIKMSYAAFFSVLPMYLFLFNGSMFSDPRYMMFLYPFYIMTVIYALYLISLYISRVIKRGRKYLFIGVFALLFLSAAFPLQINGVCGVSVIHTCPISDRSKIFTLDRWNYNHDEYFNIIKDSSNPDTIIAGRTIYDFYIEKYQIENQLFRLALVKKFIDSSVQYTVSDLATKDIILIVYPKLSYSQPATDPFSGVYRYLVEERTDKKTLYKSADGKVVVYKFDKLYQ